MKYGSQEREKRFKRFILLEIRGDGHKSFQVISKYFKKMENFKHKIKFLKSAVSCSFSHFLISAILLWKSIFVFSQTTTERQNRNCIVHDIISEHVAKEEKEKKLLPSKNLHTAFLKQQRWNRFFPYIRWHFHVEGFMW